MTSSLKETISISELNVLTSLEGHAILRLSATIRVYAYISLITYSNYFTKTYEINSQLVVIDIEIFMKFFNLLQNIMK